MTQAQAIAHAVSLARRGWGRVAPNPMVGAVVLAGDHIVGEGWHAEYGGVHAEVMALGAAGDAARGGTLVCTLEPCAHTGKQPPCVDAIRAAGVRHVVLGAREPNPEASGGADRLRAAGIAVDMDLAVAQVHRLDPAFFHRFRNPSRPYVALKLATSADFRIADRTGNSRWISGPAAREWVHWLRAGFDAVAVGGHTAVTDDPSLTVRGSVTPRLPPHRLIFAGSQPLSPMLRLFQSAVEVPTTVVFRTGTMPQASFAGVTTLVAPTLADALGRLRERGIGSILIEGGGRLAGALLSARLVDRFYWVQSPILLGENSVPAVAGLAGGSLPDASRWDVVERLTLGDDTLLTLDSPSCLAAS